MRTRSKSTLPIPVKRALEKLGKDIKDARLRRRIPTEIMAQRAFISRMTFCKVEKGDPSVSLGIYATVLFVLGMTERLSSLVSSKYDSVGLALEEERLPKRIRVSHSPRIQMEKKEKLSLELSNESSTEKKALKKPKDVDSDESNK